MPTKGTKIHSSIDEWGELSIYQDANRRMLCFGNEIEQSCIDIHTPERLCHNYTQVMMLGFLLVAKPRHCTLLGLGAGSLAHAVFAHFPDCKIDAVEQRAEVVELAKNWFSLPVDRRLRLHIDNADDYLMNKPTAADLLLTDLYFSDGMNELQAQEDFLARCRSALKPGGILICNYWLRSSLTAHALNQSLQTVFDRQVVTLSIPDGNCITFAFDGGIPQLNTKEFIKSADALGERLAIPLQKHARALMHENRQAFRFAKSMR
ncbi:MAG: methyltransferase [Sedimenticola sp.]|nr:methyltransferase [Sedimenticola sp.]MCW8945939.1 methyltransferase [Sedimenticola sp.]MCW8976589.1 methyltransferase [Sedimenticola sp.]